MGKKKAAKKRVEVAPVGEKLGARAYDKELETLHVELVKLQEWVIAKGLKVCIVFEGRDGAGKGGTIKAIVDQHRVDRCGTRNAQVEGDEAQ